MMHQPFTSLRILLTGLMMMQVTAASTQGLEGVYVEPYYRSVAADLDSTDWVPLVPGTICYRVFADLAPGWKLQAAFGSKQHPLVISTTTEFFNDPVNDEVLAGRILSTKLGTGYTLIDTWLTLGAGSSAHMAVPSDEDPDGSILSPVSSSVHASAGWLPAGPELYRSDGLVPGIAPAVTRVGADLLVFSGRGNGNEWRLTNGALAVIEGVQGVTASNRVLIGQFTTSGTLSLELNLQLVRPDGTSEQYVARNPIGSEVQSGCLIWNSASGITRQENNH